MAAFPSPPWTPERLALFADELGPFASFTGEKAVRDLIRTRDRCPSIAQLLEACRMHVPDSPTLSVVGRQPVSKERAQAWTRHIKRMMRERRFEEMRAGSQPEAQDFVGDPNDPAGLVTDESIF